MASWTDARLARLFERYRLKYWPRSRRLRGYRPIVASLESDCFGRWESEARQLHIHIAAHRSDRAVRATLLHEMVHAVVGVGGHHAPFWAQLEYLLSRRAPITVGFPEMGERGSFLSLIPKRFKRCRKMFRPAHDRNQKEIARRADTCTGALLITPGYIETLAHDYAIDGAAPWRAVWENIASEYNLVDLDGRLVSGAARLRVAARRGYLEGRRFYQADKRARAVFESKAALGSERRSQISGKDPDVTYVRVANSWTARLP